MNDVERAALRLSLDPCEVFRNKGWEPDPWQARLLRSTAPRRLLLCSRQAGKTETTAGLVAWTVLTQPGKLALVLSPSMRQSQLFLDRAKSLLLASLNLTLHRVASETKTSIVLNSGSSILSLPCSEERIRGFSPDLLIVDEAAAVSDRAFAAASPMLAATGGTVIALSTPREPRGWFHALWTSDEPWERYRVPAVDCPRISAEFLASERRLKGPKLFSREFECEFTADADDQRPRLFEGLGDLDQLLASAFGDAE